MIAAVSLRLSYLIFQQVLRLGLPARRWTTSWIGSADHDMTTDRLGTLRQNAMTVELDEIQATVLRYRP
jgi:hypothetical protein